MKLLLALSAVSPLLFACGEPEAVPPAAYAVSSPTTIVAYPQSSLSPASVSVAAPSRDPSRVLVLQTTHLGRPSEVVGVIDMHTPMGGHDAALAALKARAAEMGADAVVGVEFHHSEGAGEPTHLSGLAVRFVELP